MKVASPAGESARTVNLDKDRALPPGERIQQAFAQHQNEILGTLYHLVGNIEDARDALQEAFVKCWQHRDEVDRIDCLKAWIFRVALNAGRDLRKSAWNRRKEAMDERTEQSLTGRADDPAEQAERRDDVVQLRQAVRELRPEEKEVFLLRENGELTYEQIAEALGIPIGTVKTRMRAALARLRGALGAAPA